MTLKSHCLQRYTGMGELRQTQVLNKDKYQEREGAGEEEKGPIQDPYLKTKVEVIYYENGFEEMMGQFADESYDPQSEPS